MSLATTNQRVKSRPNESATGSNPKMIGTIASPPPMQAIPEASAIFARRVVGRTMAVPVIKVIGGEGEDFG